MEPTQEVKDMLDQDLQMIHEVTRIEDKPLGIASRPAAPVGAVTPADLLRYALDSGADLDRLEKLMDLQVRHEANEARKAFSDDMARFKAMPIEILKDKHVRFKTEKGITEYWHATIGNVVERVTTALAQFGFSHRWDLAQSEGLVQVTCVITHRLGHSQSTMLKANPDSSGGKNGIQSIISAKTYLERHTLLAATGLATKDSEDDDGAGAGIRQEEREELRQEARNMRGRAKPADVAAARSQPKATDPTLLAGAQAAADQGRAAFEAFWKEINGAKRTALGPYLDDLAARCDKADKAQGAA